LGEDAIIVATRDDEGGGIRVTAAIEEMPVSQPQFQQQTAYIPQSFDRDEAASPVEDIIADALARHQAPSHVAEKLLAAATQFASDDPVLALAAALDAHLSFDPVTSEKAGRPLLLIGPPGAGKTLSVAKFATQAALAKRGVSVISTDLERAGGVAQLSAFTRLLKLDLIEIEDAPALREALEMQKTPHVYIDTAGRNPFNLDEAKLLRSFIEAAGGSASGAATLVLPAGLDGAEATDLALAFQALGAARLLITRLDMARRLGPLLRVAFETRLPLANGAATGKVTEPPLPLNPVALAKLLLGPRAVPSTE
jgi:flagellar biosynthesis protein FlhF